MPHDYDLLDEQFQGIKLPEVSRNVQRNTASSTSQEPDLLNMPKNSTITTLSLDKSKLHDESILSFTAQGSEVASLRRRKTKSVSKSRIELKSRGSWEQIFTQLSEHSVTSKKTAYNFEPYINFISPLNEFPKLVFESAQCKTNLNAASSESKNVSNSHSKFTFPFKETLKFKFESSQPETRSNTTISFSANDSNSQSKFTFPFKDSHKFKFECSQPEASLNTTISGSTTANDSNSHSKFTFPFKESHKFKFECSQPKTSSKTVISEDESSSKPGSKSILQFNELQKFKFECCQPTPSLNKKISDSSNYSKSCGKAIIPCRKPQNFERFQPKTNFDSNISESARDCKPEYTSALPSNSSKFLEFKLEIPKINLTKKIIPNILYFENVLFEKYVSTYFETDNIFSSWNLSSKSLKKIVEINKGKRFVRMERIVNCNKCTKTPELQQNLSNICIPDIVDSKYSKNSLVTEYGNVFKSNSCITSNVCEDKNEFPDDTQQYISKLVSNSKVTPIQAYQLCLVLKDSPVSYILESASNEFNQESEYVFDLQRSPIPYSAMDDNAKNHDEIFKAGSGENSNKELLANDVPMMSVDIHDAPVSSDDGYEPNDDECQMMQSIYDNIYHLKTVLDEVEKNSESIRTGLGLPLLCINEIVADCSTVRNANFNPTDFINTYGNIPSFKMEKLQKYERSLAHRSFKNERQNTVSPVKNFRKKSEEEKSSMLPFETNLLLIDSILSHLENTYQNVQREVSSWSTLHETDLTGTKFKNGSLSTTEDGCLANARKCLAKFKDRRGSNSVKGIGRRFSDSGCSFSLINNEIRRITGKVSSAEKKCSFSEKGVIASSSVAKYYESVWTLSSSDSDGMDGQVDKEISNDTEKISAAENDSLSKNSNCILKFKGRHASASRRKYNDFDSSSSDSDEMTGRTKIESSNQSQRASPAEICSSSNKEGLTETSEGSHNDYVKISLYPDELNEPTADKMDESEVDDSESSLEGSFKNFRTSSRLLSPITSGDDSDDSSADDVPRFSLPPPKSKTKRFYSKKTEYLEQVSCKEWSLKKGETEISLKCTRRGRRFRSDELCAGDSLGITEDIWQDDLGIPSDLLQDFNQFTTIK